MARVLYLVTGWETSSYEAMRIGELQNQIYIFYNNREGMCAKDDTLPDRFINEEIDYGPHKGDKIDSRKFKDALLFYYDMVGWDKKGKLKEYAPYDCGIGWLGKKGEIND